MLWITLTYAQEYKLEAFDAEFADLFGHDVAIDGDYAIVGAPLHGGFSSNNAGAAYVFHWNGAAWEYQSKLTPPWGGDLGDQYGYSVDIAGDYAIVGAINTDIFNFPNVGSAYIYRRSGTNWVLLRQVYPNFGQSEDRFGNSVGINSSGIAIVGAVGDDQFGTTAGAAYIFEPDHYSNYVEVAKLIASDASAGDAFGTDVAIDSIYAVVGAPSSNGVPDLQSGAAYVFKNSYHGWSQVARLTHTGADVFDHLGQSVDIDGTEIIVGAPFANDKTGEAYVFNLQVNSWVQIDMLAPSDGVPHDKFGTSVGITAGYAIVGSYLHDDVGTDGGSAYLFSFNGTDYDEDTKYTASDGAAYDKLGLQVDIDGTNSIAGAREHDGAISESGAAYIFAQAPPPAPCLPDMMMAGVVDAGVYHSSSYIELSGTIPAPNQVYLTGPSYIALMPNTEVMLGSVLEVSMAGCP